MTTSHYAPDLYANTTLVEGKTGLPQDYNSLFAAYGELVKSVAGRLRMPIPDQEDAAQEVQLKFWLKDGLSLYDPNMGNKFAAFYKRWTTLFSLQERDKGLKYVERYDTRDPEVFKTEYSAIVESPFEEEFLGTDFLVTWLDGAEAKLRESGNENLVPLLNLCAEHAEDGTAPSRAEVAKVTGRAVSSSTNQMRKLRKVLTELGMGMESLYD